jgi:hypothetical protein
MSTRPVLGPTQPPIQWVQRAFLPEYRGRIVKLTTHLQLVPSQEYVDLYIHSSIRLHGVVDN